MPEQLGALLPRDRKYLSRKQLDATHAADPVDLAKVKAFAKEHRLEVLKVDASRRSVLLAGSAADVGNAVRFAAQVRSFPRSASLA